MEGVVRENGGRYSKNIRNNGTTCHAYVVVLDRLGNRIIVFEPHCKEVCSDINRLNQLSGGSVERVFLSKILKSRKSLEACVCFGEQMDTDICRSECYRFLCDLEFDCSVLEVRDLTK